MAIFGRFIDKINICGGYSAKEHPFPFRTGSLNLVTPMILLMRESRYCLSGKI